MIQKLGKALAVWAYLAFVRLYIYSVTCLSLKTSLKLKANSHFISDRHGKNYKSEQQDNIHKTSSTIKPRQKHGLTSKQRQFLIKELSLLNATGRYSKKMFLKSHHKNSSKDFVVFMSTSDSAVEVNKAPQEHKDFTEGGVVATSGLHYHDQYTERYEFHSQSLRLTCEFTSLVANDVCLLGTYSCLNSA